MPSGPYLPTSAAYLKESSLLLQAYPDSTRITTKYTYPKPPTITQTDSTTQSTPLATLTLKTYTPEAGICLKYRTNKAAEVGRLITALGLLAGGADLSSLDKAASVGTAAGATGGADVEMGGMEDATAGTAQAATGGAGAGSGAAGKGGKGKGKKKGKK
ncbi:SRP9/SRP21 family protein [Aspergillus stella-maris]|uniref:SRP9/SRP21 family protein n=1 Tax=Aspergillus stella-maris TaxID=1810926 RepID=UPI003CCD8B92